MKVPVFFLSIFFVLLFGSVDLFAGSTFSIQPPSSSLNTCHTKIFKHNLIGYVPVYSTNHTKSKEYESLFCEEVEDSDFDESSSRKDKLVNGFLSFIYDQSHVDCYHNCVKVSPFLWRNKSQRYTLLGTLRI